MARPRKTPDGVATLADVQALLGEVVQVEAAGLRLRLTPPTAAAAIALRNRLFAGLAEDREPVGGVMLEAAGLAVAACLGMELDEDEAARLILRAGGESGPLAREALRLCGLDAVLAGDPGGEGAEVDPDPFSSPAKPAAA